MVLHTVNRNYPATALTSCLKIASPGSTILLIEEGVYNAADNSPGARLIMERLSDFSVRALLPDVVARGLQGHLIDGCLTITDAQFVELTTEHEKVLAWF